MTHDLRTPLAAAETSYKHLQEGYFDKLTENQNQVVNLLMQSNAHTLRLVNNLLSVHHISLIFVCEANREQRNPRGWNQRQPQRQLLDKFF